LNGSEHKIGDWRITLHSLWEI